MVKLGDIMVIDSDPLLSGALAEQLHAMGYAVTEAAEPSQAFRHAPLPDLLLIAGLPEEIRAIDLVQTWRAEGRTIPILVLVASTKEARSLAEAGADSCLEKPYRLSDLSATLSALMRDPQTGSKLNLGRFQFHPPSRVIIEASGRQIRLTEKEAEILSYLHRAGGRSVPRSELLDAVWGYSEQITTHTLETHIYRLRQKLADGPEESRLLTSEDGGYKLVLPT